MAASGVGVIREHDTPWYLRAGEEILRRGGLPQRDPFSYTADRPWLNHEWLAEVLLALVHRASGMVGLGLLQGCLLALTVALLMAPAGRRGGLAPLGYATGAALLREVIAPRAQLFSDVLLAATLALCLRDLDEEGQEGRRAGWGLLLVLPLGLLWTQLHGGNPHGVALLGLLALAAPSLRRALLCGAAALLTCAGPYGIRVHGHFLGARHTLPAVLEWQPLWTSLRAGARPVYLFLALVAAAALALWSRRREPGRRVRFEALALLLFSLLALRHVRFLVEATIIAMAVMAPALARVRPQRRALPLALALVILAGGVARSEKRPGIGLDPERFPEGAVGYLRQARPPGPMLNSYNFGGYLLWAYPEEPVFIDGRAFTVYSEEHIRRFLAMYDDPTRFLELDRRHRFRLLVLQRGGRGAQLLRWILAQPGWRLRYADALSVVITRVD